MSRTGAAVSPGVDVSRGVLSGAPRARVSVLHVLVPAEVGGLEAVVQALALGARGSNVEARVAAVVPIDGQDHPFLVPLRNAGVGTFTIEAANRRYLQERAAVARLCRTLRPDVVHTHGYRADVVAAAAARRLGIPVVSTVHGFTGGDLKNRFYQWLQRRVLRGFDAVIAVSRGLRDELAGSGVPRERLHYVQNAWYAPEPPLERHAARHALRLGDDGFRVGWIGRLSREKGPDVVVEAMRQLRDLPLTISFVGIGPMQQTLEVRAAALHVGHRLQWHRLVPGAGRLLNAFDAVALTSRVEGTPIVLLEAMAAGVPIIASAVGGVPDVVSSREALLVPAEDPRALAAAIRNVQHDPAAARQRALAARERLHRQFGHAAWLAQYEAIYGRVRRACAALP